jgi:hypothetical protein
MLFSYINVILGPHSLPITPLHPLLMGPAGEKGLLFQDK